MIHATYLKLIHGALSGNLCDLLIYYSPRICFSICDLMFLYWYSYFCAMVLVTGLLCQQVYVRYRDGIIIQLNGVVWSSLFGVNLNVLNDFP